jgi:hypothetical protein
MPTPTKPTETPLARLLAHSRDCPACAHCDKAAELAGAIIVNSRYTYRVLMNRAVQPQPRAEQFFFASLENACACAEAEAAPGDTYTIYAALELEVRRATKAV